VSSGSTLYLRSGRTFFAEDGVERGLIQHPGGGGLLRAGSTPARIGSACRRARRLPARGWPRRTRSASAARGGTSAGRPAYPTATFTGRPAARHAALPAWLRSRHFSYTGPALALSWTWASVMHRQEHPMQRLSAEVRGAPHSEQGPYSASSRASSPGSLAFINPQPSQSAESPALDSRTHHPQSAHSPSAPPHSAQANSPAPSHPRLVHPRHTARLIRTVPLKCTSPEAAPPGRVPRPVLCSCRLASRLPTVVA